MKDFRRLKVWEKAHHLTLDIYKATTNFPRAELYGLTSQMRRCSASMGANIAEGCGKQGNNELHRFLHIASGSASELDYQLLLARDLNYMTDEEYRRIDGRLLELRRMLTALIQKVGADRFAANC
ncbi:MAG: four helix bundle protein [Acidobacteriia bacterium]|nr:four helix bundle protein [Terriglobia bacterium]